MDTMNSTGLSLDRIATLANKRHPLTGDLIRPLGRRANGQVIWPIMGGSGDGDEGTGTEGKSDKDEPGSEDGKGSGNSSTDEKDEKKEKPEPGSLEARIAALEDEKERQYERRMSEKERADKAEARVKELEDADKDDATKSSERVKELEADNQVLNSALLDTKKELAFLRDNSYNWHNPSRAMSLLDMSRVEFDDDGKVIGMKEAIEALAKTDPYLIKEEKAKESDEKDGKDKKDEKPPKSGDQKNSKDKGGDSQSKEDAELISRYPGLRR